MNKWRDVTLKKLLKIRRRMVYAAVKLPTPKVKNSVRITKKGLKLLPKCYKKEYKNCPFPISHSVPFLLPLSLIFHSSIPTAIFVTYGGGGEGGME